jgi:hypothetical protein
MYRIALSQFLLLAGRAVEPGYLRCARANPETANIVIPDL